jgi:hypothetical protein
MGLAKQRFRRPTGVLLGVWIFLCLFLYPVLERKQAEYLYQEEVRSCSIGQPAPDCREQAASYAGLNDWSFGTYYKRDWAVLSFAVALPALYICLGIRKVKLGARS